MLGSSQQGRLSAHGRAPSCWRVSDPVKFLQTVRNVEGAEVRINDIVSSEVGAALGRVQLTNLVSVEPGEIKITEIMGDVTERCRKVAAANYGIDIESVSLKRLNFPEQNKPSVFNRMRAEREEIAKKYRAEGSEEAMKIRATGHADSVGNPEINRKLAKMRAESVTRYLVEAGVAAERVVVDSHGDADPLIPTGEDVPEVQNRRVEIRFEPIPEADKVPVASLSVR